MVDEIIEIQKFFSKMTWGIDLFIQNIDVPTELTLKVNAAPVFAKQVKSIETIWKKCVEYTKQAIINNNHLSSSFQSQYELFYQSVLDKHYKGFIRTTSKEKFDEIQERIAREDFDVVHARYVAQHDEYKAVLFDLLKIFRDEVKNIITKHTLPIDELNENLKRRSDNKAEIKPKTTPTIFVEIFTVDDWRKYIDALVYIQLLDSDYNFIGNPNKHKGVIASWFYTLQNEFKVIKASVSRSMLMLVVNNELPNLEIKSDKIFEKPMKSYGNRYKKQLESFIENVPIVPST